MKLVSNKKTKFPFMGQVMKAVAAGNKVKGRQQHPNKFDLFPADDNDVVCPKGIICMLYPKDNEPQYDEKKASNLIIHQMSMGQKMTWHLFSKETMVILMTSR